MALPFASSEAEIAGIRVTRAEFSRLMGCSKQAVTDWVKSGRITVGADGRLDPRQAVASLLRTGDPARLRANVLAPMAREMAALRERIAQLEAGISTAQEQAEFQEGSANELLAVLNALPFRLALDWDDFRTLPAETAMSALAAWIDTAVQVGHDPGSVHALAAPGGSGKGATLAAIVARESNAGG